MSENKKGAGLSIASLCCGIGCFILNPCYLTCLAAIVLGIVALCTHADKKGLAITGLILGCCGTVAQFIVDLILSVFTAGLSFLF